MGTAKNTHPLYVRGQQISASIPAGGIGNPTRALGIVVDRIVSAALDTNVTAAGATVDAHGTDYRGDGIVVAVPEYGASIHGGVLRNLTREQVTYLVRGWVEGRAPEVIGTYLRPRYFGAWVDDSGTLYLDVVEAYSTEDRELAVEAGRRRNQISVWDAGRGVEIPTGGTGEVAEHAPFRGQDDDCEVSVEPEEFCEICKRGTIYDWHEVWCPEYRR